MRVSRNVFNVTFFCSNKQINVHKESVIRHIRRVLSYPLRNTWQQASDTVCLQPWFTKKNLSQ